MLTDDWDTVRLFLHVLAATVWVGGQLTLAPLVPVLSSAGAEVPRAAARTIVNLPRCGGTQRSLRERKSAEPKVVP